MWCGSIDTDVWTIHSYFKFYYVFLWENVLCACYSCMIFSCRTLWPSHSIHTVPIIIPYTKLFHKRYMKASLLFRRLFSCDSLSRNRMEWETFFFFFNKRFTKAQHSKAQNFELVSHEQLEKKESSSFQIHRFVLLIFFFISYAQVCLPLKVAEMFAVQVKSKSHFL